MWLGFSSFPLYLPNIGLLKREIHRWDVTWREKIMRFKTSDSLDSVLQFWVFRKVIGPQERRGKKTKILTEDYWKCFQKLLLCLSIQELRQSYWPQRFYSYKMASSLIHIWTGYHESPKRPCQEIRAQVLALLY